MSRREITPQIWVYATGDEGEHAVKRRLSKSKTLTDINVTLVNWVAGQWYKRNTRESTDSDRGLSSQRPTLQFPLSLGRNYEGDVVLSKILNGGTTLSLFERVLVRRAFRFRRTTRNTEAILSTQQGMTILAEQALQAMLAGQRAVFDEVFDQMTDLHADLLLFGESVGNDGQPTNYGLIHDDGEMGSVQEAWARGYRRLFEESVNLIERERHYFGKLSYMAQWVLPKLFGLPSLTGIDAVIEFQGYLWYRLNGWWGRTAETQRLTHDISHPVTLIEPQATVHLEALKEFIAPWETTLPYHFRPEIEKRTDWKRKVELYPSLVRHLSETALFLARSVLTGNRVAVTYWADVILGWCGNALPWNADQHLYELNLAQKVALAPNAITLEWEAVHEKLSALADFEGVTYTPSSVFANLVYNMWQDTCFVLCAFLVQWAGPGDESTNILALEGAKLLIDSQRLSPSEDHSIEERFYNHQTDFIASFLRRNSIREWALDKTVPGFWRLAEQFEQLTREPMMVGRVYSWGGNAVDRIQGADLILGSLKLQEQPLDMTSLVGHLPQWLYNDSEAVHLIDRLNAITSNLGTLDVAGLTPVFNYLQGAPLTAPTPADTSAEIEERAPAVPAAQAVFADRLNVFTQMITSLRDTIAQYRRERISRAPVSQLKLDQLAAKVAGTVFDFDKDSFIGHFFGDVRYTPTILEELGSNWSNFPKGVITDPRLDQVSGSDSTIISMVTPRVKGRALGQILNAKRASGDEIVIEANSQDELGQGLLRAISELTAAHTDPVILIGSGDLSGWIRGWSYAPYRRDATLPEGITVERSQVRSQNGYVFDVSGTPVYSTEINLGGVWVLAREAFIALKVTKPTENGIPVRLTFTPDSENPLEGAMHIRWNQGVETDGSPIFILNQPEPAAPPEQPT